MSLHGTLETFALPDVMALLAATKKTGELRVVGGKLDGRVHLDAGRVIGADVGRADSFVDAVFELLRLTSGKFSFDADKQPETAADPVDVEPLLLEASARLSEWREIEAVVPSLDHGVVLSKNLADPHVTLAAEQWRMVVAVAGARCAADVADRLGLGEYAACKSLKDLVESGVVEVTDPPKPAPAPAPKAEAKPEPKAEEPKVEAKKAGAEPDPLPEPKAEAKPQPKAEDGKVEIEPELKPEPLPEKPLDVPVLTAKDQNSPIPPGEEPGKVKKAAEKPVDAAQAKQLVSQLAAMGSAPDKPKPAEAAEKEAPALAAKADAETAEAPTEGGEGDEPLNRGLLLKFLSSVRQ